MLESHEMLCYNKAILSELHKKTTISSKVLVNYLRAGSVLPHLFEKWVKGIWTGHAGLYREEELYFKEEKK